MEKNCHRQLLNPDRRHFLRRLGSLMAAGVVLDSLAGCSTGLASYFVKAQGSTLRLSLEQFPQLQHVGGAIEIEFIEEPGDLVVVRTGENAVSALSPTCTHLGCTVRKEPSFFRCPCHGSTYTLEGEVVRGPAERALDRYPATLAGSEIIIALEK